MSSNLKMFDGHNDTIKRMFVAGDSSIRQFLDGGFPGQLDLPRMKQVNLAGGFFSICPPEHPEDSHHNPLNLTITNNGYEVKMAPALPHSEASDFTDSVITFTQDVERQSQGRFQIARTAQDITSASENETVAAILHFEGAEAVDKNLENLQDYYNKGLRSLGLVWSRPNVFGEGVQFKFPASPKTGSGLTQAGKSLVKACNKLGVVVDLSHINEKGFWDVETITTKPLVVTHTAVHSICPSTRNITDKQIDAVGASDGIVGVYFEVSNLRRDAAPIRETPLSILVEHITYLIDRIGIDHVGLGSDFDGAVTFKDLNDVSGLPKLVDALRKEGLSHQEIQRLTYDNWLRVLKATFSRQ